MFGKALSYIGQRLQIDAFYFARQSKIQMLFFCVQVLTGITTTYLIARLLPAAVFGEYKFITTLYATIGIVGLAGMEHSYAQAIATHENNEVALRHTVRLHTKIALLGVLGLLGSIGLLWHWNRLELWPALVAAAIFFVPGYVYHYVFSGYIKGTGTFTESLRVEIITGLIKTAVIVSLLWVAPYSALLFIGVMGIPALIKFIYGSKVLKKFPSTAKQNDIFAYGGHLTINQIPLLISQHFSDLFIAATMGLEKLAIYAVAIIVPEQAKAFAKTLLPVSFAKQATANVTGAYKRKLCLIVSILTVVSVITIVVYWWLAPLVLPLLFPLYEATDMVLYSQVMSLSFVLFPSALFVQYLEARKEIECLRVVSWLSAIALIVSTVMLVPTYGVLGIVIGRLVTRTTTTVLGFFYFLAK